MKAGYRERVRNLLCVLTGVTVIVTGTNPTVVEAVASSSSENLLNVDEETELEASVEEEAEQKTEPATEDELKEGNTEESSEASSLDEDTKENTETDFCAGVALILDTHLSLTDEEVDLYRIDDKDENSESEEVTVKDTEEESDEESKDKDKSEEATLVLANVNEYVNIREDAQKDAEKVGVLYKDCGGTLLEQKDGWSKIKSGDVEGWVRDEYLYVGEAAEEAAEEVGLLAAVSTTQSLRVRKAPSEDAGVYGLLACNEAVEAISDEGEWIAVDYNGNTGYVAAEYVTVEYEMDVAESMEEILNRERQAAEEKAKRNAQKEAVLTTASEVDILAALIQCEAGGEGYEGQVAVGSVVMNRVRCGGYPNSITEVIYASGQFSPATSGKMNSLILNGNIKESCRMAAQEVINGTCNIGDALHFRRSGSREGYVIGNHVFW